MDSSTIIGLAVALVVALYNKSKPKKAEGEKPPKNRNPFDFLKEIQEKLEEQERENQRKILEQKNKAENYRKTKQVPKTPKPQVQANYQKSSKPSERDMEQEELEKIIERQQNQSEAYSKEHSIMQAEREKAERLRREEEDNMEVNPFAAMLADESELKKAIIYKEVFERKEY